MLDAILELQKPIMLFFQNIRSGFGDALSIAITYFGDAPIAILVLILAYWCIDKRKGFALGGTLLSANFSMNIFKVIFRVPRPWVKFSDLECIYKSTATGYSFPSGHSTTSGALWGAIGRLAKKSWAKALCVIIVILVPLSRVYLGCHWPMDVLVGTALGLLFAFFVTRRMYALYDDKEHFGKIAVLSSTVAGAIGLVTAILLEGKVLDELLWKDLMETAIMCSGLFLGAFLEKERVSFAVPEKLSRKITVFAIGATIGIGTWLGIKAIPLFPMIMKCIAYFFIAFWASFIYPLLGVKFGLFEKE